MGYTPNKSELWNDLLALKNETITFNFLGKDGGELKYGAGFISEWAVHSTRIEFKFPSFIEEVVWVYRRDACSRERVNSLKGVSSRLVRKKNYPGIRKKRWGGALWSPSYFAGSCGGAPIAVIRQYIEQQQTPH